LVKTDDSSGLVPAVEIIRVTLTLQECIRDEEKHGDILKHIKAGSEMYSMQTFDHYLVQLVAAGKVSSDEAKCVTEILHCGKSVQR
jgi:Tfp pilus assembly pilus retraction ATPase PilT